MTTQEILLLVTLIATSAIGIIGFALTIYQIRLSNKVRNAEFFNEIIEKLRFNERSLSIMYLIEYDEFWYDASFHGSGELEKSVDAFLSQIDYICYLLFRNLLSEEDFQIFEYEVGRVCSNEQCQEYLWNLYHWAKCNKTKCSFDNLIKYLKTQFNDNELNKFESNQPQKSGYNRYLNF